MAYEQDRIPGNHPYNTAPPPPAADPANRIPAPGNGVGVVVGLIAIVAIVALVLYAMFGGSSDTTGAITPAPAVIDAPATPAPDAATPEAAAPPASDSMAPAETAPAGTAPPAATDGAAPVAPAPAD